MRAGWPSVVLIALLAFLPVSPTRAITIQPKHETDHQGLADGTGQAVRPESADERIADYTEWLAFFTAALVVVSTVQIGFLIRADKTAKTAADAARAVSGRVKSEGDSQIEGNLIDDLRRLEAARDGSVVFGFTQEGDFGGH